MTDVDVAVRKRQGPILRRIALVALGASSLVLGLAGPASAHGGPGVIEVGDAEPGGELTVVVQLRITYEADGHEVEADALGPVTVDGTEAGGAAHSGDVAVAPTDVLGVFDATVVLPSPGTWDLTLTSSEPPATADVQVVVADPDAAEPDEPAPDEPDEGTADEVPTDDGAGSGDEPVDTGDDGDIATTGAAEVLEQSDESSSTTPLIVAMVICAALVVGGAVLLRRARQRGAAGS